MEKQIGEILKTDLTDEQKLTLINVIISPKKKEEVKEETKSDEIVELKDNMIRYYKMMNGKKVIHRENGPAIINILSGSEEYYYEGKLHREGDYPAVIREGGKIKKYYKHGIMTREGDKPSEYYYGDVIYTNDKGESHRENGPALITADGNEKWYFNDKLHRDGDKPAIYNKDMTIVKFYKNGNCHRDGDMPAIYENNTTKYLQNGEYHRDGDLPAIIDRDGPIHYYKNGKLHRDGDKPAIIYPSGLKVYYTNGVRTKVEYDNKVF
jgi:hypothetical protein